MFDGTELLDRRLLLADDDPDYIDFLAGVLRRGGAAVTSVSDGVELLEALAAQPFDLVITDHRMPAPSGAQAVAMALTAGHSAPFLIVTGYPTDRFVTSVAELGGARVLGKPFEPARLVQAAIELITSRQTTGS